MLQWYEAATICSPCGTLNARQLGAQGGTKDHPLHTIDVTGSDDDATRGRTQPGGRSQTAARSTSASESFILLDLR
ncbi:unnamed protein product [Ixodes pacificus]